MDGYFTRWEGILCWLHNYCLCFTSEILHQLIYESFLMYFILVIIKICNKNTTSFFKKPTLDGRWDFRNRMPFITWFLYFTSCRLRALSSGGSVTSPPPSPAMPKYKLAEYRYGREEMLALYIKDNKVGGENALNKVEMEWQDEYVNQCWEVIGAKSNQALS